MNTIIIFCVIVVSSHHVLASKKDINPLLFYSQQTTNNCKTNGLQCKDCQTIQYCSSNLESLFEIHCEDQSRLRPYCDMDTNTCVKDKPLICDLPETSFHCPGSGYYPDLEDCTNYHICDENKVATKMSCPTGENWIQGSKSCTAGIYCRSYSPKLGQCKGKTNKLVAYANDKNMYVLCLSNGPILFQCPNKWEIFDEAEVTCKFECTQNGFFPHPSDPRKFYSCTKEGKGYTSVVLECPEGYDFAELGAGQGICTSRPPLPEITTEAIIEATTILEQHNDEQHNEENNEEQHNEENNNEEQHNEENNEEQHNEENNNEEQHNEENNNEEQHNEQDNNEEQHNEENNNNQEEIVEDNNNNDVSEAPENNEDPEETDQNNEDSNNNNEEEHHPEEADQNNEDSNNNNEENLVEEHHSEQTEGEESASAIEEIDNIIELAIDQLDES